jgi:hypothetical protein
MEQPEQHTLVDEATFMNALPENVKELFTTQVAEQPESSKPEDAENEEETEDNLSPLKPPSEESPHQESPTTTKSPSLKPQTPQYEILSAEPLFVVTDDPKTSIHAIEESGAKEITSEILDDGNNNEEDQDEDEEEVKTDSVLEAMKKSKEAQKKRVVKKVTAQKQTPAISEQIWDSKEEVDQDQTRGLSSLHKLSTSSSSSYSSPPSQSSSSTSELSMAIKLMQQLLEEVRSNKSSPSGHTTVVTHNHYYGK